MGQIIIAMAVLGAIAATAVWAIRGQERAWQQYVIDHKCKNKGVMTGDVVVGTGVGANGQFVTTVGVTPDKTIWVCADGRTIIR